MGNKLCKVGSYLPVVFLLLLLPFWGPLLCKRDPQTPRKHQRGRVSILSLSGLTLSTTKEGPLRRPLFGNTPWLFCGRKGTPAAYFVTPPGFVCFSANVPYTTPAGRGVPPYDPNKRCPVGTGVLAGPAGYRCDSFSFRRKGRSRIATAPSGPRNDGLGGGPTPGRATSSS